MAWNEPGGNNNDKDPWSGGSKQGPPDLDEALRKLQRQLNSFFGGSSGGNASGGVLGISLILVAIFLLWALSGIYIVRPAEKAVVLRFGKYQDTVGEGPHWAPRLIDSVYKLDVEHLYTYEQEALMLNRDENIVSAKVAVIYRRANPREYFFNVLDPQVSLQQATASALRQVVGHTSLDDVLTVGREKVRSDVFAQLKSILEPYKTGIEITDVRIQSTKAPDEVKDAFDDAIKAREDMERYRNQALGYAADVVPVAKGNAKRIIQEAEAYKSQVTLQAQGDVARYLAILPEYQKAPTVTRERLYLSTMQDVFANTSKILVDSKASQNLMYLPVDRLLKNAGNHEQTTTEKSAEPSTFQVSSANPRMSLSRPSRPDYIGSRGDSAARGRF